MRIEMHSGKAPLAFPSYIDGCFLTSPRAAPSSLPAVQPPHWTRPVRVLL